MAEREHQCNVVKKGFLSEDSARVDPYPRYAEMRTASPVVRIVRPNGLEETLVMRYEDARRALLDSRLSKEQQFGGTRLVAAGVPRLGPHMLNSDPPDHSRLRRVVAGAFTWRNAEAMRPAVTATANALIDALIGRGDADMMAEFAFRLPIVVVGNLIGVPATDRDSVRRWTHAAMLPHYDPGRAVGLGRLTSYIRELLAERRERPQEDLLSLLIAANYGQQLTDEEVVGTTRLLLIAGLDTSANLIGNGLLALLRHPEQQAYLRERPEALPTAIEELLRYDGPLEFATMRFAKEDLEIGGCRVPRESAVSIGLASANRDSSQFEGADKLDITRVASQHLAFGHGVHHCLGAPLARLEGQIAIGTVLRRLRGIKLATPPDALRWRHSIVMRGLEELPVTFQSVEEGHF